MPPKLSPEGEVLEAHMDAMRFAFRTLIRRLEDKGTLEAGEFVDALRIEMELRHEEMDDMVLGQLAWLREAILE